jgi:hypothetical protein
VTPDYDIGPKLILLVVVVRGYASVEEFSCAQASTRSRL